MKVKPKMTKRGATASRPYTDPFVEQFEIHSEQLERGWGIQIGLPMTYHESKVDYPVLYVMDGQWLFNLALEVHRLLYDEVGELVIVGVGAPSINGSVPATTAFMEPRTFPRAYLYSPSAEWALTDPFGAYLKREAETKGKMDLVFGGAPKLLEFLASELHPVIAERYRVRSDDMGLFGTSAAGQFALYCLLSGRSPFKKYIAGSPVTAYNDGYIYDMERKYAATYTDLDARIFIGAGDLEATNESTRIGGIVSGLARFTELFAMRNYPSLACRTQLFAGEGHATVAPYLLSHGLQHCWPSGLDYHDTYRPRTILPDSAVSSPK